MTSRRSYPDACGLAQALNVIGERWALLLVRELMFGPRRFTDLDREMPGISRNVLSQRLIELEERRVIRRRRLPPPAAAWVYELTEWGKELEPAVRTLGRWGARSPHFDPDQPLSCASIAMSMRTMFRPELAGGSEAAATLRLGHDEFTAVVTAGAFSIARRTEDDAADLPALDTDPLTLAALIYQDADLSELERAGRATVRGDRDTLDRLLGCFRLPEPAQN